MSLSFSRPGKPADNAVIENFNGSFRDECPNTNLFLSLEDAERRIEAWRRHNDNRPHMSPVYATSTATFWQYDWYIHGGTLKTGKKLILEVVQTLGQVTVP